MTIRELQPEEWDRLKEFDTPIPPKEFSRVVIAEDTDGSIVGYWMMVNVIHLEPIWIDPTYRGGTLIGRMWKHIKDILDACHISAAFCFSDRDEIDGYLTRLNFTLCPTYKLFLYVSPSLCHSQQQQPLPSSEPVAP